MTFSQGELVRYRGKVIGYIAGLYAPHSYPGTYTVIGTDEAVELNNIGWWDYSRWTELGGVLDDVCAGTMVHNFHERDLQKCQTKLGNTL